VVPVAESHSAVAWARCFVVPAAESHFCGGAAFLVFAHPFVQHPAVHAPAFRIVSSPLASRYRSNAISRIGGVIIFFFSTTVKRFESVK